jgi:hypothetical protein
MRMNLKTRNELKGDTVRPPVLVLRSPSALRQPLRSVRGSPVAAGAVRDEPKKSHQ